MTFKLFDVVRLETDLPEYGLSRGAEGVVVELYDNPTTAYEVEFTDSDGRTQATIALLPDQVSLKESAE
jgi:hypothetical protein